MKLSVMKQLIIVLILALFCLAGIGYLLYKDVDRSASRALVKHVPRKDDRAYYAALSSVRTGVKNLESAELGYVLSGEEHYLTAYRKAEAALRHDIGKLKTLSADAFSRLQEIEKINTLVTLRLLFTEQVFETRARRGQKKAHTQLLTGFGKEVTEQIETGLAGLEQAAISEVLRQDRMVTEEAPPTGTLLIAAAFSIPIVMVIAVIAITGRAFLRREPRAIRDLQEQLRMLSEGMTDCTSVMLGPDGRITHWNASAERITGFATGEIQGRPFDTLFPEEDVRLGKPQRYLTTTLADGRFEHAGRCLRKDGSVFPVQWVITSIPDQHGGIEGLSVLIRDVTELRLAEELLAKLSLSVEQAADLVVISNMAGRIEYVNKAVEEVTGYTRNEFIAGGMALLQTEKKDAQNYKARWESVLAGHPSQAEVTYARKSGEIIYLEEVATPIKDNDGKVTHVIFTSRDLTPVKLMRDKLDFLASYDALTGLPNRNLFTDRLSRAMTQEDGKSIALLAIDIDRFKYINEIYGLEAGNKVLQQVAESLSVSVSKGDLVCRLGSDEFGLMLQDIVKPSDVLLFVKMIMKNVPQIIMSGGEEISVTLDIGIAMVPADARDAGMLMKNADTALSKAKELGRNHYQLYNPEMNVGVSELVFMERRLSEALRNQEYILTFQPYWHMSTKKICGAEALLRWNNDEFGMVSPSKFIPMLEETGMIIDVGTWVLKTACQQIKLWNNGSFRVPIAVNISPSQFRHEYLIETVESAIRESGIEAGNLTLEITESTFMKNHEYSITVLQRLKEIGVSISIDDFGTGYSSLSYLKRFPVDFVKIDQSFVKDVATDPDTTSLVSSIISMSHSLNLKTIAEGVETEEQWKILRLLKCDLGQGFHVSGAVAVKDFEKLLV